MCSCVMNRKAAVWKRARILNEIPYTSSLSLCVAVPVGLNLGKKMSVPKDIMMEELNLSSNRGSRMFQERQKRAERFTLENAVNGIDNTSSVRNWEMTRMRSVRLKITQTDSSCSHSPFLWCTKSNTLNVTAKVIVAQHWGQFWRYEFSQGPLGFKNRHTGLAGDPKLPLDVGWCGDSRYLTFPP